MAHRSQCSSAGDNPLDPNYLPPHYREEYRMAIDALVEDDLEGYYEFLREVDVVDFLSRSEIEFIRCMVQAPHQTAQQERRCLAEDVDGSSDTYWPVHSDHDAPNLDLGWPQQYRFVGPTEVTTLINPPDPEMPSIKEQVRRMIKNAQQVIAVVMDMFTDVDIFADILGAATRGVAVYVLLDELNAQHFVGMVNNCRVNLDEIKFMRVRTVSGSTYSCRTGKTFKGQMMDRFILVDCRAVLSGNYSFMWSFEKIHRCLAHLFLGQLVTTFDEEFRILFAHSEPLVVENVLANMPHYGGEPEGYYNTEKTHMFNRQYPTTGMEWAERTAEDHMNVGQKMLPFRSESIHSATEANPSVQRHMNLNADQQYRGDYQSIEHGRQMRGPNEMVGIKRHSYGNIPDYEYLPPQNLPAMRGSQHIDGAKLQGGHLSREHIYQGAGLQSGYDLYGKFRGQDHHIDQFSSSGYSHEGDEPEPTGSYDHVQRYLQSQSAMEEGHGPINVLLPVQSNVKRHSMGQSYTCQKSPKQPNLPEQKRFFNVNHKPQELSKKQGLRDWRISSYLSAYDDAGELDLAELEGSSSCSDVPCFTQEAPCGPVRPEIRPGNREFNRIPSRRENPTFVQIQNDSILPDSSVSHPTDLSQINIKTTPASTSESSCTTEGDKGEETQNREPKETNRISEDFLKSKPSRTFQRSSRLRHSLIFSSNLELHTSDDMKDTAGEKDGDEASKPLARVSHILDKRRTSSPFQPFQWSNFVKSNTFDNSAIESAQPEDELNKIREGSDLDEIENSQKLQRNDPLQEKDQPQTAVLERKSQRDECPSNLLQKSSSFIDMNDPDCRLRYFKELAAKRKLAAAKVPQSNPIKATQKFALPEESSSNDADKNAGPVFKSSETELIKNTTVPAPEIKETCKDTKSEESSKDIMHRATDAEKIRFKRKLAEESGSTLKPVEEARTASIVNKPTSSEPCSKNSLSTLSATLEAQNQVQSVVFNTSPTESGLIQFYSPKETDHSHASLAGSCLPVKLPQTKSSLSTTQSEGCLFTNDSQTITHGSPNISSTYPDTVSLDFNSKPNFAIVDTSVSSKPDHIDPTPAFSASGISSLQHPTATKVDSFQYLSETVKDISRHSATVRSEPPVADSACSKQDSKLTSKNESDFTQNSTVAESEISKQVPVMWTDTARNESSQQGQTLPSGTAISSSQPPTVIDIEPSQKPISMEIDTSQQSTASVVDAIQQPNSSGADTPQNHTTTQCEVSPESFRQPSVLEESSSQQHTVTVTDSSQQLTATTTDSSQQPTTTETDSSQQPTVTVTDSSQQPSVTVTDSTQQPTVTVTDSSQQPTVTVTDSSQQPTVTVTDSSQQPTVTVTDSSQQPTVTVTDSSQQPTVTVTDSSQQPTVTVTDSSQQPTVTVTDSSQQPSVTVTDSSQQPTVTVTDSSQQPTVTVTDSSQQPTVTVTDSSQQPTVTVTDSSQQSTVTVTDSSQQPITAETDSCQKPITTEQTDYFQKISTKARDSSHQPIAKETDSSHQNAVTESDSSQNPTKMTIGTSKHPFETENESIQHINAAQSYCVDEKKKKDDNLSVAFSKPIPDPNITQADNSISQITVITDLSSTAEHSQSGAVPPCDIQTQAWTEPCKPPTVEDMDNGALTSLNSVEVSSIQPQSSTLPSNEINSTLRQLQSSISSNPMESSCLYDAKPEECQKNETITEQSQKHETSAGAEGPKITQTELSTATEPKQTTPEVENSVTNFAEVSLKSDLTAQSNSENRSSVAKNPKSVMSAHQSSTANVISCSNLRDDTKVLLEQISAKNQSRSSQSKQTLAAPNEAKEDGVRISNSLGRLWSSKATPEERDMLIQKMEKMRKERKVYSRFEAS